MKPRRCASEPCKGPEVGVLQWFWSDQREHVEEVLADLRRLGVQHLRTGFSWADWDSPHGIEWYEWLLPRLASEVEVVPCFLYTPPSCGIVPKTSSPPRNPKHYADFLDTIITRFGRHFEWVELWNEPNNLSEWDWTLDPQWWVFCEMVGGAAYWARARGKKTVLGGMSPTDPNWLRLMFDRGVMPYIDAVGLHGFPGVWEYAWEGWPANVDKVRRVLDEHGSQASIWITEAGFSTWRHEEHRQLREFVKAIDAPADRVYWYSVRDLDPDYPTVDGFHTDDREYHFGIKHANGRPKLLYRAWAEGGLENVRHVARLGQSAWPRRADDRPVLITGGAGFLGSHLTAHLVDSGRSVVIFDNLSRSGTDRTARVLQEMHGERVRLEIGDVRDRYALRSALQGIDAVYHLASIEEPCDAFAAFETNCRGTLNLLEELAAMPEPPRLVHASTHLVYSRASELPHDGKTPRDARRGRSQELLSISETAPLEFLSAYICAKGAADQYVLACARRSGLPAVVLRLGIVYGPGMGHTEAAEGFGNLILTALDGSATLLPGNGQAVRDLLHVDDAVRAMVAAEGAAQSCAGERFNIGGGIANAISETELLDLLGRLMGREPLATFSHEPAHRPQYFVSDTGKLREATGWFPRVTLQAGLKDLHQWFETSNRRVRSLPWTASNAGVAP